MSQARFVPALEPADGERPARLFAFRGSELAVREEDGRALLPDASLELAALRRQYLGELDGDDAWAVELAPGAEAPGLVFRDLRTLHAQLDELVWSVAGRAFQVVEWDRTHQFCGVCGAPTELVANERARRCTRCGHVAYPRITPAIIVAVTRGDELLMARNAAAPAGRFSVLAGFVEPGETLEQAVAREVLEEVGVSVRDVRYFASQSWPFPSTLMIGFTASWAAGEIAIDDLEIAEAGWFRAEAVPPSPRPGLSISGALIGDFVERSGAR